MEATYLAAAAGLAQPGAGLELALDPQARLLRAAGAARGVFLGRLRVQICQFHFSAGVISFDGNGVQVTYLRLLAGVAQHGAGLQLAGFPPAGRSRPARAARTTLR
jgi:hypothetical protein